MRFIPAGAGNSYAFAPHNERTAVYPRWRGELRLTSLKNSMMRGLSPLARGTPPADILAAFIERFIPAGAGNSCLIFDIPVSITVYPRWRGEL